jgi:hypothetical protein
MPTTSRQDERETELGADVNSVLAEVFAEVTSGSVGAEWPVVLNSGDAGLFGALDTLSAEAASRSVNSGATIAAHVQHVRHGLSIMNRWAAEGGDPFADRSWDDAWVISAIDEQQWTEMRAGLREESERWLVTLRTRRTTTRYGLAGMIGSIVHVGYHLGALRQIEKSIRGPRQGTFDR